MNRIQCMRDTIAALDINIDELEEKRNECCGISSSSSSSSLSSSSSSSSGSSSSSSGIPENFVLWGNNEYVEFSDGEESEWSA